MKRSSPGARSWFRVVLAAAAAVGLFVTSCAREPRGVLGSARLPSTNGLLHEGHPAIGRVIFARTGGTKQDGACTATLVGKRTVVTAAHCLVYPLTEFVAEGGKYKVTKVLVHPKYDEAKPYLYDIGVVRLERSPPLVPMRLAVAAPLGGTPITMIGFGETSKGAKDNGIKRIATNVIDEVRSLYFTIDSQAPGYGNACYGDSGGPVLVESGGAGEAIVGLLSYITGACGSSTTRTTRVDLYLSWLSEEAQGDLLTVESGPDAGPDGLVDATDATSEGGLSDGDGGCVVLSGADPPVPWLLLLLVGGFFVLRSGVMWMGKGASRERRR